MRMTLIVLFAVLAGARLAVSLPANHAGLRSLYEHDVAVETIICPEDTTLEDDTVHSVVRVRNLGRHAELVYVAFYIYDTSRMVFATIDGVDLEPGERVELEYPVYWIASPFGSYYARASHNLRGDENRSNDTCHKDFVVVRFPRTLQVEIRAPRGTVVLGDSIRPSVQTWNCSHDTLVYRLYFEMWDPGGTGIFRESTGTVLHRPMWNRGFTFRPVAFCTIGWHACQCSLAYISGRQDSVVRDSFYVEPSSAIVEGAPRTEAPRPQVSVCRGTLTLPGRYCAELHDIMGRKVSDLEPGENDIRHLAPGVYFCRPTAGYASYGPADREERPAIRKVVIQR
ncbi:MAG: hypothetical protein JSU73_05005 [candidate division WOR-3 bacterium]|nr:MAG: hypothetical protein JSU73_05005 [candidate division WOR-3 bacterium]